MSKPKELFELEVITDNPLFEGFGLENSPSLLGRSDLLEDITPGFDASDKVRKWKPVFLSKIWKAPKVCGSVAPFNDFPGLNMILPVFSQRACEVLRDFLEPNGELLPLDSDSGQYFFYNITKIVDALDVENSVCEFWCDPSTTAIDIQYYFFKEEMLNELSIFRIYENPIATLVTNDFVKRVHEYELNGFQFNKIWPFPKDVDWRVYNKNEHRLQNIEKKRLKQNTLVISLILADSKPNAKEIKQINNLENELDAQLKISAIDAPYFGCFEGYDIVNNEYLIFISCPDADALAEKLFSWLKELNWSDRVYAMKRYGEMYDAQAKEEIVEL
ncbi:MAG: hypothetical protein QNJ34_05950 [Xenococcaceae cyanobacterium MO_188.B29]|nr:hypothetical protein [Xenococcaceae cyanobacterium MO_188.B29]